MARGNNNHNSVYKPTPGGNSPAHVSLHMQCTYNVPTGSSGVILLGLLIAANSGSGLDKESFIPNCI